MNANLQYALSRLQGFDKLEVNRLTLWLQTARWQDAQRTNAWLQLGMASLSLPRDGRQKQIDLPLQGFSLIQWNKLSLGKSQPAVLGCPQENFHTLGR